MLRRPFDYRSWQASADQELHNNLQQRPRRYQGYYEPRDIDGYVPAPLPMSMSMLPQLQTPLQPGIGFGMQHAVGSVPMQYPASQNYQPALNHMQPFNGMGPSYGVNSFSPMAHANFQNPPHHLHQLTDFSHLMMQPPQRNNTPEPTTTSSVQQLPLQLPQVPPPIPFASHSGPATLQTSQQPQMMPSTSHPVPYMNVPATQQATGQFPSPTHQVQQEAGPSTHSGQPVVQTLQYAPRHSVPPPNQPPQQEAYPSAQPGQPMAQTPQYVPPNHSMPLSITPPNYVQPSYVQPSYVQPNNGQSTRPTGSRYQGAPQQSQMHWNGRGGFRRL
jgi:hypothetical protein